MTVNKTVERSIRNKLKKIGKIANELGSTLGIGPAAKPCDAIEKLANSINQELNKMCPDDWEEEDW